MTIVFRRSETLDLCALEFSGAVSIADLIAHLEFRATHADLQAADTFHFVHPDMLFTFPPERIDDVRSHMRSMLAKAPLPVIRRTTWICKSDRALPHLKRWLLDRAPGEDGLYVTPRLVETIEEAAEWLIVPVGELRAFAAGERSRHVGTLEHTP
ncbi:MAG: hypothetical protein AB7J28_14540 [Hyphomonadaceae bacterium]